MNVLNYHLPTEVSVHASDAEDLVHLELRCCEFWSACMSFTFLSLLSAGLLTFAFFAPVASQFYQPLQGIETAGWDIRSLAACLGVLFAVLGLESIWALRQPVRISIGRNEVHWQLPGWFRHWQKTASLEHACDAVARWDSDGDIWIEISQSGELTPIILLGPKHTESLSSAGRLKVIETLNQALQRNRELPPASHRETT